VGVRGVSVVCSELRGSGRAAEKGAKGKREDASRRESWVRDGRRSAVQRVPSDGS